MRILELGALNHMDKGYVSRAWRSLEAFGFVEVIEAGQSRSTVIGLTGAGRNAYLEWRKVNADIVAETFAEWDDADLGELKDLLERVVKSSARLRP
jgi:DNA-binding MarR family transcriptional regulator